MSRLANLVAGLPRPYNTDPLQVSALTVAFVFGANFIVRNGTLTTVVPSGYSALSINLRGQTLTQVAATINATANYSATVGSGLGGVAAYALLEGQYPSLGGATTVIPYFTSPLWRVLAPIGATLDDVDTDMAEGQRQLNLITSTSVWLDRWGLLYGVARNAGEVDFSYARRILLSVIAVKINGFSIASILQQIGGLTATISDPAPAVYDTFNRVNSASSLGTANSGQAWTATSGTWGIQSGQAYPAVNAGNAIAQIDSTLAGTQIQCQLMAIPAAGAWRLVFRLSDASNFWYLSVQSGTNNTKLTKVVAGTPTDLATATITPVVRDVFTVKTVLNVVTAYQNGTQILTATDAFNNTATRHGIGAQTGTDARFDYFASGGQPGAFTVNATLTDTGGNPYDTVTLNALIKAYKALGTQGTLTFGTQGVDNYATTNITDTLIDSVGAPSGEWGGPEWSRPEWSSGT